MTLVTSSFDLLIRAWFQMTHAPCARSQCGLPSEVCVTHQHCWIQLSRVVTSISTVAAACRVLGSAWLTTMAALLATTFCTHTSLCLLHIYGLCCHICVLLETVCHGHGSKWSSLTLVGNCIHRLFLDQLRNWVEEVVSAEHPFPRGFSSFASFELDIHVLVGCLSKHGHSALMENDVFHSTINCIDSSTRRVAAQESCSTSSSLIPGRLPTIYWRAAWLHRHHFLEFGFHGVVCLLCSWTMYHFLLLIFFIVSIRFIMLFRFQDRF